MSLRDDCFQLTQMPDASLTLVMWLKHTSQIEKKAIKRKLKRGFSGEIWKIDSRDKVEKDKNTSD